MPGQTSLYRLPYPIPSDPVNAGIFKTLAQRLEVILAGMAGGDVGNIPSGLPPTKRYRVTNINRVDSTGGAVQVCSVSIPDPGYPYRVEAFGSFESGNFTGNDGVAVVTARVGTSSGKTCGRGRSSNANGWGAMTVVPHCDANDTPIVGAQTIRFYLTSALNNRKVTVSDFNSNAMVNVIPAE